MIRVVAFVLAATLAALGLIHLYWVFGGHRGKAIAVPEADGRPVFTPSRWGTLVVAAGLFGAAWVSAVAGQLLASPLTRFARPLAFLLAALFLARAVGDFRHVGFFKRNRGSAFARMDSMVYSPLCLAMAIAALVVAGLHV